MHPIALAALSAALLVAPVRADSAGPYETLHLEISALGNPNRNEFHDYWHAPGGFDLNARLPFHRGSIELGVHHSRVRARELDLPDFRFSFAYAGWGVERSLATGWTGRVGVRTGNLWMVFERPPGNQTDFDESEIGLAGTARLGWHRASGWSIGATASYRVVLTARRLEHVFVGIGVGRTIATPGWLVGFLQ